MDTHAFCLQQLLEQQHDTAHSVVLPASAINTLTQVRKTLSEIDELADSIAVMGQIEQGIAVALGESETIAYLHEWNAIHCESTHHVSQLTATILDGVRYFIILIAGHRRYTAVRQLCARDNHVSSAFSGMYRARLYFDMSVEKALALQFQENRHQPVPPHEEAAAATEYYRYLRRKDPKYTLAAFGKQIGRSASWIRHALAFCALPEKLQELATAPVPVPYGMLVELSRYQRELESAGRPASEDELSALVFDAMLQRKSVKDFKGIIGARIAHLLGGQSSLFDDTPCEQRLLRRVVAPEIIMGLWSFVTYMKQLSMLQQQGVFTEHYLAPETNAVAHAQFSPKSPVNLSAELVQVLLDLQPSLDKLVAENRGRGRKKLLKSLDELEPVQDALDFLRTQEAQPEPLVHTGG